MSRTPKATYQSVSNCCHELLAIGDKPSIPKIHEKVGGSFSTISKFFQQWQAEHRLAHKTELSESFQQAALAEFARVSETIKKQVREELENQKQHLTEIQELLLSSESRNEQVREELADCQKTLADTQATLEKELAIAKALTEDAAKREASLQNQIEGFRQALQEAQ